MVASTFTRDRVITFVLQVIAAQECQGGQEGCEHLYGVENTMSHHGRLSKSGKTCFVDKLFGTIFVKFFLRRYAIGNPRIITSSSCRAHIYKTRGSPFCQLLRRLRLPARRNQQTQASSARDHTWVCLCSINHTRKAWEHKKRTSTAFPDFTKRPCFWAYNPNNTSTTINSWTVTSWLCGPEGDIREYKILIPRTTSQWCDMVVRKTFGQSVPG